MDHTADVCVSSNVEKSHIVEVLKPDFLNGGFPDLQICRPVLI